MGKESATYDILLGKNTLSKGYEDVDKAASKAENTINRVNNGGGGSSGGGGMFKSIVGGNLMAGAISKATGAIIDFGKESFNAFGKYEQFGVALTTMFHGNKAEAKALQDELVGFAKTTPFELTEIQDATKQLIAYGSTSGTVGKELRMLGDISSGVGAPIGEIAYLYGTARTQGRLFARDIYQLSGRGIPIVHELAKQFKTTDDQVMKLVEHGKVGFEEMKKAMASMTAEGGQFAGMMEAQSKTVLGKWSNMMDAVDQLKVGIGNSQSGLIHAALDFGTAFVSSLANSIKYTNDLNDKLGLLGVSLKFNENIDALKGRDISGNMSAQSLHRVDLANKQSTITISQFQDFMKRVGTDEKGKKLIDEFVSAQEKQLLKSDAENLAARNRMNKYDPMSAATNNTEFIRLFAINEDVRRKMRSMRDSFLKGDGKGTGTGTGTGTTSGSGVTIEAGTPKNVNINITNFQPNWKVESVDTDMPIADIKDKTGKAMLELLNDAALMDGQQHG